MLDLYEGIKHIGSIPIDLDMKLVDDAAHLLRRPGFPAVAL